MSAWPPDTPEDHPGHLGQPSPGPQFIPPPPAAAPQQPPTPGPQFIPPPPAATGQGSQPPPPTGTPQFVSTPTQRPRIVTNTYDHERARWGLGDMLASLGVYFFSAIALILLIVVGGGSDSTGLPEGPWLLVAVVGPHTMLLAHLFWVRQKKGISFDADFQLRFRWSDVGLAMGLFFGALISAGIVAIAITEITGEAPTASATELAQESGDDGLTIWLILFAFLGATLIPVVEELVYRGLFWSALEKRGMRPWTILVITSAVFALIHLEPIRTAVLFVVGMAIGIGRLVTGRVGASIATHVFINAMAMTATLVQLA